MFSSTALSARIGDLNARVSSTKVMSAISASISGKLP